ncbi:OmpA family protein [Aquabacterium sp. A7-Y]|uniref:OmpA family protein n=1 Tax=Aquabacterium sp. A7-Y TaxID=1349605 RepID=UPI00223D03A6|nr:OmpA family protein [Aquabacterium sp. A7-Y]MCW7540763.1 OmpA family protein [Aquabacterium sp. A7-Y]
MSPLSSRASARLALALAVAALVGACGDRPADAPAQQVDSSAPAPGGTAVLFEANQTVAVTGPEFVAWRDRMLAEGGSTKILQVTGRAHTNEQGPAGEDLGRARAEAASILFMEALPPERIVLKSQPATGDAPSGRFEAVSFEWVDAPSTVVAAAGAASGDAATPAAGGQGAAASAPAPAPAPAPSPAASASVPVAGEPVRSLVLYFGTGSATPRLGAAERQQLKALVGTAAGAGITVLGHADKQGQGQRNQALSEARAQAVRQLLVRQGASAASIQASGQGDASPADSNDSAEGRARNRRVEIRVQ